MLHVANLPPNRWVQRLIFFRMLLWDLTGVRKRVSTVNGQPCLLIGQPASGIGDRICNTLYTSALAEMHDLGALCLKIS